MRNSIRIIVLILFASILVGGSGCSGYKNLVVGEVQEVRFSTFEKGNLGLELDIPVENPSGMNFKISEVNILVLLNDLQVGTITSSEEILIEKHSEKVYTFPLDVNISGLSGGAKLLLSVLGKGNASIETNGYLKVRKCMIGTKIPIHSKDNLNLY